MRRDLAALEVGVHDVLVVDAGTGWRPVLPARVFSNAYTRLTPTEGEGEGEMKRARRGRVIDHARDGLPGRPSGGRAGVVDSL